MSDLSLMKRLLDGVEVEFKPLGKLAEIKRGTSIIKRSVTSGEIPVIAGGRSPAYFHNVSNREGQTIVISGSGAYSGFVSWWDQPIFVSDAFTLKPYCELLPKYAFYWLQSIQQQLYELKSSGGVPHVYPRNVSPLKIPIPYPNNLEESLAIQTEIVLVLDTFTELNKELNKELNMRKKQYNYYRDKLLAFQGKDVEWKTLGELGELTRGKRFTKADYVDEGINAIHYGEIYTKYGLSTTHVFSKVRAEMAGSLRYAEPGDLIMASVGETIDDVGKSVAWLGSEKVAIHDDCFAFSHSMNPKFVSYAVQTSMFIAEKSKYVARAKVKRLSVKGVSKLHIPVPYPNDPKKSLAEQTRIVAILDKFDALTSSISEGLPREIELRQKQYEYYRDLLLSFPKLEVVA